MVEVIQTLNDDDWTRVGQNVVAVVKDSLAGVPLRKYLCIMLASAFGDTNNKSPETTINIDKAYKILSKACSPKYSEFIRIFHQMRMESTEDADDIWAYFREITRAN